MPSVDEDLAHRLLASQFPQWAELPLKRLEPAGSDNVILRLGEELSMRLPRGAWAAGQATKEHRWLPHLAPRLPLALPVPVGLGTPEFGYPWDWSVSRWLDGEAATVDGLTDPAEAAADLAAFFTSLRGLAPADELRDTSERETLRSRDHDTREAIAAVEGTFDTTALTEVWDAALTAPEWAGEPVWVHGDMHNGNLLTVDGRLSAVIDFGGLGIGDPACDLVVAWTLFPAATRPLFRAALGLDDATWARGRGWAISTGLNAYTTYAAANPLVAANTTRQITWALADR
ncbi:aminoglycoside phosphotransferase family protein [Phytomonospora sp. NPDC050363]|uniref:aminoglycoside phosphotransferase family protein n=1 Tax=Phytomonospora sp. NPDC050363 TaxID=3155642 RepID=UPI0033D7B39F